MIELYEQPRLPLDLGDAAPTPALVSTPSGYSGLYAFHKYWGKKPWEPVSFLIQNLSDPHDLVLDPFMGSGVTAREALRVGRRFIGIDLNPIAVEISKLLVVPPAPAGIRKALTDIQASVRLEIEDSYERHQESQPASHYLWDDQVLREVWVVGAGGVRTQRRVHEPTKHDLRLAERYDGYESKRIRPVRFFTNSRINASPALTLNDLFTGRALRNMDLLLDAIEDLPSNERHALELCLTAASGQMSNMVFAITGRGKTKGHSRGRVEVGSWVIGFWRPKLHFEINAWNCFARRTHRLVRALATPGYSQRLALSNDLLGVLSGQATALLRCGDALTELAHVPENSIDLIVTDPPHSDRVPYLELSDVWNAMLGQTADFKREIVVSNARERGKDTEEYSRAINRFLRLANQVLKPGHFMVLLFNARDKLSWESLATLENDSSQSSLEYRGHFSLEYSARSVLQDTRKGSLKSDLALVFQKPGSAPRSMTALRTLGRVHGWTDRFPGKEQG
jgi:SAM-dependent methyltransferase